MDLLFDELRVRHGLVPGDGVQLIGVDALARRPFDPGMPLVILPSDGRDELTAARTAGAPAAGPADATATDGTVGAEPAESTEAGEVEPRPSFLPTVLPGRDGHGAGTVDLLRRLYPAGHPVLGLAGAGDTTVADVSDDDLGRAPHLLPAVPDIWNAASPYGLPWLVARLRAPGGCPWDREQDHLTLRPFLLEEAYEVYDALESGSTPDLAEELGDLLLQIVLHAQFGAEAGVFDLADVHRGIMTKIVRRHPHVFGDVVAGSADEVIRNWERIKADERAGLADGDTAPAGRRTKGGKNGDRDMPAAFAGLSRSLPALAYASEMQGRAASLGYDWPDLEGVIDKVAEEAGELLAATNHDEMTEEFGDLLFVIVNLGRKLGVDPEAALRAASRKFASRFAKVERLAAGRDLQLRALGLDELDDLWHEAKAIEREEAAAGGPAMGNGTDANASGSGRGE